MVRAESRESVARQVDIYTTALHYYYISLSPPLPYYSRYKDAWQGQ
tara:strand:- start:1652 stop:1789 length:138 start_codon:yes stop_codon:yes gene_type:complete